MTQLVAVGRFVVDFVVGDDPWLAGCVMVALLVTLGLDDNGVEAWWLLPGVVATVLVVSVARVAGRRSERR
jgi:hypothetical protein